MIQKKFKNSVKIFRIISKSSMKDSIIIVYTFIYLIITNMKIQYRKLKNYIRQWRSYLRNAEKCLTQKNGEILRERIKINGMRFTEEQNIKEGLARAFQQLLSDIGNWRPSLNGLVFESFFGSGDCLVGGAFHWGRLFFRGV